jgi:hypothetical protein
MRLHSRKSPKAIRQRDNFDLNSLFQLGASGRVVFPRRWARMHQYEEAHLAQMALDQKRSLV